MFYVNIHVLILLTISCLGKYMYTVVYIKKLEFNNQNY